MYRFKVILLLIRYERCVVCTMSSFKPNQVWGYLYAYNREFGSLELKKEECSVGREGCDLLLPVKTANISRKHFSISNSGTRIKLKDWSLNGTYVNGEEVGKDKSVPLKHNDIISLVSPSNKAFVFMKASELNLPSDYHPSEVKEKYDISYVIGEGGYGQVSLVFEKKSKKKYALKYIEKDPDFEDALMVEVKILQQLHHPFIIELKEVLNTVTSLCLVLELMEGGDLYQRISPRHMLNETTTKLIFYQTASAVKYLHDQGITHRDLKPQNILLSSHRENTLIKVTDFGVSKSQKVMQTVIGTLFFIAPEILKQHFQKRTYTNKVDIWSLGVILYNCLSGEFPFPTPKDTLIGDFSLSENKKWQDVSSEAKDIITKMLTLEPGERFTVSDVLRHPWLKDEEMRKTLHNLIWEDTLAVFNEKIKEVFEPFN